jgi:cell division protein FtsZ
MIMPGLINLDFADIRTVMSEMGKAMMGTGEAEGERRSIEAAEAAISNPLLDEVSMKGARAVLINITGGLDMTLFEVDAAANRIREEVDANANIIFGSTFSEAMDGRMRVSVVATGIISEAERKRVAEAAAAAAASPVAEAARPKPSQPPVFRFQQTGRPAGAAPQMPPLGQRADLPPAWAHAESRPEAATRPAAPFVPPPLSDGDGARAPSASGAETPRSTNLLGRFREFAFTRTTATPPLRPGRSAEPVVGRERPTPAGEEDEIAEIPAFLRKERVDA